MPTAIEQTENVDVATPIATQPTSMDDFELMPMKACLINDPDCESCQ